MKRLFIILLLLPVITWAQVGHLRILDNGKYAWLKGSSLTDTVLSADQNNLIDFFGTIRIRGYSSSSDTTTYKPGGFDINGNFRRIAYWPGGGAGSSYTFQHSLTENSGTVNLTGDAASPGNTMLYGTNASGVKGWYAQPAGGVSDHGGLTGLSDDDHTQYALLAGRAGGQSWSLGTGSGEGGTLQTTTHATKGTFTMVGHMTPGTTGTYDFGTTGTRWRQLYVNGLNINSSSARADNTINVIPTFTITNGTTPAATGTNNIFTFSSAASAATSGTTNFILWGTSGFAPTSGTAIFNQHRFAHTINQTGGANGITRTLFIDPTITAAADYRAIESTQGAIRFGNLIDATTADSILCYEDGFVRKKAASALASGITSINGETGAAQTLTAVNGLTRTTTTNNVEYKLGGTLSESTTISGATFNLSLGTGGSKLGTFTVNAGGNASIISDARLFLIGNITYSATQHTADANLTVPANTGILELSTASLTTDRTITLPTATTHGQVITVVVRFASSGNHYVLNAATEDVKTGSTFTQLDWGTTYEFMVNASVVWMLIRKY